MNTKYKCQQLEFQGFGRRKIIVKNDGKMNTTDGGYLLLQQIEQKSGIISRLSECFTDEREQYRVRHSLKGLLKQRIFGLCTEEILERLVEKIRIKYPEVKIIFRGDSGFCRDGILNLCESLEIDYVVGMAGNNRLHDRIIWQMIKASKLCQETGLAARVFTRFPYRTRNSWSCERQVVAKTEHLPRGKNPRFIVTNISSDNWDDKSLYEVLYCGRGDMENRIKDQQLNLFADRTSTWWMSSNQLRLWFSTIAYIFFVFLQKTIQKVTSDETRRMPQTIRLKMLKVSAAVKITVRNVWISLPESYPYWDVWIKLSKAF
jgi:hypothetical protein